MKRGWRFVVAVVAGLVGWLWLLVRLVPSLLRGKATLPPAEPVPVPDTAKADEALQRGTQAATDAAAQAKAPHLVAIQEAQATVDAVTRTRSRAKRRELLAKLADKVDGR